MPIRASSMVLAFSYALRMCGRPLRLIPHDWLAFPRLQNRHAAYVIVNNPSEGNAPLTIQALMKALQAEISKRRFHCSQAKKRSASQRRWYRRK